MAVPETKNVIMISAIVGIALIAAVFLLKTSSQPQPICGNSIIESGEQCDNLGCPSNQFCNNNCFCQSTTLDKPIRQSSCPVLGGKICSIGSSCTTSPVKLDNELCCLSSCTNADNETIPIDVGQPINSIHGRQGALELFKNTSVSRSSAGAVATSGCTISTGEKGVICEEQFCNGDSEDLCCIGSCNSFPYDSYAECYNFCLEQGVLTAQGCDVRCR